MKRILLSVPHMGGDEETYVRQAFATNWLSTVGPNIAAFEKAFAERVGLPGVALASGTAGLHAGFRDAWEIALEMSVSHTVSMDSRLLLTRVAVANRCPLGDHLEPANDASCSISASGRAQNASCSFFLERFFVLVFRGSQGRSPRRVQEGLLPPIRPIHPRIPPRSPILLGFRLGSPCENGAACRLAARQATSSSWRCLEHDGWVVYRGFEEALHQSCLNHLLQRCREMMASSSP